MFDKYVVACIHDHRITPNSLLDSIYWTLPTQIAPSEEPNCSSFYCIYSFIFSECHVVRKPSNLFWIGSFLLRASNVPPQRWCLCYHNPLLLNHTPLLYCLISVNLCSGRHLDSCNHLQL